MRVFKLLRDTLANPSGLIKAILIVPGMLGFMVLLGWHFHLPGLIQIHPTLVPMQYNTALGFLLSSVSFLFILSRGNNKVSLVLAAVTLCLGLATLMQYLTGIDLRIDQALMEHYILVETSHPGRMAPNTAVCFMLTGAGLLLLQFGKRDFFKLLVPITIGAIILGLGLISIVGYVSGLTSAYGWGGLTRMALHTAAGFMLLGGGTVVYLLRQTKTTSISYRMHQAWSMTLGLVIVLLTAISLENENQRAIDLHIEREARGIAKQFYTYVNEIKNGVIRKARRGEKNEMAYRADARVYIQDIPSLVAIGRLTEAGQSFWWEYSASTPQHHVLSPLVKDTFGRFSGNESFYAGHIANRYLMLFVREEQSEHYTVAVMSMLKLIKPIQERASTEGLSIELFIENTRQESSVLSKHIFRERFELLAINWVLKVAGGSYFSLGFSQVKRHLVLGLTILLVATLLFLQNLLFKKQIQAIELDILNKRLAGTLDAMLDSVVVIDQSGMIADVNAATLKLFGYSKDELLNQNVHCLMPESFHRQHDGSLNKDLSTVSSSIIGQPRALKAKKKNGDVFPVLLLLTPSGNSQKQLFIGVIHDLSDFNRTLQDKLELEEVLNTAMESSSSGWAIIEESTRLSYVNPALANWLGYEKDELIALPVTELLASTDGLETRLLKEGFLSPLIAGKVDTLTGEVLIQDKTGSKQWALLTASAVKLADNRPIKVVAHLLNIDEQKKLKLALEQRNIALEKSNAELDQFAYIASHDLKSPLNAISKLANWIIEDCSEQLPESGRNYLQLIKSRTQRMARLLDDLLAYSRIGRKVYDIKPVNLKALSRDIVELQGIGDEFNISAADITLQLPSVPFELVLRNLISNAVKHHHNSCGHIQVSAEVLEGGFLIKVADDGPGIPYALQSKAVEMFETLQPRDEVEGSGMGLAFCKKTLEFYRGRLSIHSDGQNGTTIEVYWPFHSALAGEEQ